MFEFNNKILLKYFDIFLKTRSEQKRYSAKSQVKEDYIFEWGKYNYGESKRLQYEWVQLWNNLPTEIRSSNSPSEFKNKFKSLLLV